MHEHQSQDQIAIRTDLGAIFVSLELSRSTWLITSLSPGAGERLSKYSVSAGDIGGLLARFAQLQQKAAARLDRVFPVIAIQEAGLDGFWIHRVLRSERIETVTVRRSTIVYRADVPSARGPLTMNDNSKAQMRFEVAILTPHTDLDHAELQKVTALEHARNAAQRLLLAAEADENDGA